MPIPKPNTEEAQGDFMSRCISFLVDEGTPNEQAIAICYDAYQGANKREAHKKFMEWKAIDNKRQTFQKYAERIFYKALRKQYNQYIEEAKKLDRIDFDLDGVITTEPIYDGYVKVYKRVLPAFGQDTYAKLQETLRKQITINWDSLTDQWIAGNNWLDGADTTSKIVLVTETTKKAVRKAVQLALIEGTSVQNFARELSYMPDFSYRRGVLIGRTEIISASNAGSLLGAQASGVKTKKVWLATQDNRTRHDHVLTDGQVVDDLEGLFYVGENEEPMQYPGDSTLGASASNTINCRCTVTYRPYDDNI